MDILQGDNHFFLLDTGADISLIKKGYINPDTICFPHLKCSIVGITSEKTETLAVCSSNILLEKFSISHQFHIVPQDFPFYCSGILGKDFLLKNQCKIDYSKQILEIPIPFQTSFPVQLEICSLPVNIQVPSRSSKYVKMFVNLPNNEYICNSCEIQSGVFVANSIIQVKNNFANFSLLNINDYDIETNIESIKTESLEPCDIFVIHSWNDLLDKRIENLENNIDLNHLNLEEKSTILDLCREYNDVFHLEGDQLSTTSATTHEIPLIPNSKPIYIKQYRLPESTKDEVNKQVSEMLANDIIQNSKSPWNFPLIVVPKKSADNKKKWRLVIDFRKLNEITVGEVFPIPQISEILDQLGAAKYFSTLDLATGYHQVFLKEEDRSKTAFSTTQGHFEFKRMPFGLKNAPATFQRLMNNVISGLTSIQSFVYLDDVVVYGYDLLDHNRKLKEVFDCFRQYNLKLQPSKCHFLKSELVYLGHLITDSGIHPDPQKLTAIQNYPVPRNAKEIKSFIGLAGYYRKFIDGFATLAKPLNSLLKKNTKFVWNAMCDNSFRKLKNLLMTPPILQYPNFEKEFSITCDASNIAIGAVLSQPGENNEDLPISFASRTLNSAETHYSAVQREVLAIVWAVKFFRPYIYGRCFKIITDHRPLTWLYSISNPASRLIRWKVELDEYDYKIVYKPGKSNQNADALSRIKFPSKNKTTQEFLPSKPNLSFISSNLFTRSLPDLSKPEWSTNISPKNIKCDELFVVTRSKANQLQTNSDSEVDSVLPNIIELTDDDEINKVLEEFHNSTLGGHQGISRTYDRIKSYYKFSNMFDRIKQYVKNCPSCQKNKSCRNTKMPMKLTTTSEKPLEKIFLDIVGPLPVSMNNNKYILTLQDDLTKYSIAMPIPNQEAITISKVFVENFICKFGSPDFILTDQGTNFMSDVFKEMCKLLKIKKLQTTAYHPQTNGALERSHRTLTEYLRTYVDGDQSNWDTYLPYAMFCYNSTPHSSTNIMPFELLHGFKPTIPTSLKSNPQIYYNYDDYLFELKNRFNNSYQIAKDKLISSKEKSKTYYDRNCNVVKFNTGDNVLVKNETQKNKFEPLWHGPYEIIEIISNENSKLKMGRKLKIIHNNRLKIFNS